VLEPELPKAKADTENLAVDLDDVIIYALYPVTGKKFLRWKYGHEEPPKEVRAKTLEQAKAEQELMKKALAGELVEKSKKKSAPPKGENLRTFNVFVEDDYYEVGVDEVGGQPMLSYIQPMGQQMPMPMAPAAAPAPAPTAPAAKPAQAETPGPAVDTAEPAADTAGTPLTAPMPGMIINYEKQVGDSVDEGETLVILEAMKMENALPSPASGTVKAINFGSGDSVAKGDVLCVVG
jgi:oxaloacetate decarboxylase alpha subunit/pyruvate carboxylase subunit B